MKAKTVILVSSVFLLISCAQVVSLTGGDKDIEPPKELESIPKNGSINFAENEIIIEFDEFIQLQNLQSQLIVSPLMAIPPEIVVKGKKLVIKLQDTLQENTTYSLNFGEAIKDITENNPIPNYKYVFSTGDYLDSLNYSGNVINAYDLTPKEKMVVLLYNQVEDSVPYKELPRYISITDKEGDFSISNISNGRYKVFAINDINGNYLVDLPNEEIAFLDTPIVIESDITEEFLYAFAEEVQQQYILKSENKEYSRVSILLNSPTVDLEIKTITQEIDENQIIEEINATGDTLSLWLTQKIDVDNVKFEISDTGVVVDTVSVNMMSEKKFDETNLSVQSNIAGTFDLNQPIIIKTKRPVKEHDFNNVVFTEDSSEVEISLTQTDSIGRTFIIDYNFKENSTYQLFIPPSTFIDYFGLANDSIVYDFKTKSVADYGIIALTVSPNFSENYIVQLYKNNKLVRASYLVGETTTKYEYLKPGNYKLKMVVDGNNDHQWTTGNYLGKQQPEKVIYYEKDIVIKANWDNDINWIIKE